MQRICVHCRQPFEPNHPQRLYCSERCKDVYYKIKQRKEHKVATPVKPRKDVFPFWICQHCRKKKKLDFSPLREPNKMLYLQCKCGYQPYKPKTAY
jgi:hypothetical protein